MPPMFNVVLLTLATFISGFYTNSHDTIRNNRDCAIGSDNHILRDPSIVQNALTPPLTYDEYLGRFWCETEDDFVYSTSDYYDPMEGTVDVPLPFVFVNGATPYYNLSNFVLESSFTFDMKLYSPDNVIQSIGGSNFGVYMDNTYVGKGATGTSVAKLELIFSNTSNKVMQVWLDCSSNSSDRVFYPLTSYNGGSELSQNFAYVSKASLYSFYVTPNTTYKMRFVGTSNVYLDGLYYRSLGDATSYTTGYDDGYGDGVDSIDQDAIFDNGYATGLDDANQPWTLVDGLTDVLGVGLNAMFIFLSLDVFGIELSYIFSILLGLVMLFWILKIVRG